ncbi:hypothetical protein BRE01_31220 [Brevibacillus reuszeri]|uniref:HTH cro/C1-type domain-containing protein n=1 Tax=Brevibacillus reuszeri TaxID=54915 RepID=A0A0K9YYG2_9BACL|nr:helix-turn-helix transcriptional regulator [Brevibacillus reuszeri]KNB73744.1 hypothetical protein ADS79_07340 [Brevibacillus reuszeri]MED1858444.1 helix-turn-helix transcriptional regulator [Brevibacillus reuszeri]GED69420.1 hypothetical protein BRE01_31220 [Brevibacillus reuszeri]
MTSTIASMLKSLRKQHKLMQKDVADKLGISESAYGFYEQGRREPSLDNIKQLAEIFNVSVDYLLTGISYAFDPEKMQYVKRTDDMPLNMDLAESKPIYSVSKPLTKGELLQELTDDPDDFYFLDGYLDASEEEKKELRKHFMDIKRQMRENNIKSTRSRSLFEITEDIKKSPKND